MKIYIDGCYYSKSDAKISVFDHGLLYGDGVFEGIRIYNGKAFLLKQHLDRLYRSAKVLNLDIGLKINELEERVLESIELNHKHVSGATGYIRLVVTRGEGDLGLDPANCAKASIIIITDDISLYPKSAYECGIKVITSSVRRNRLDSIDPRIKSLNYLNNIMAKIEAKNQGVKEAIILNDQGRVAECTADNIFIIQGRNLITPLVTDGALQGITRATIMQVAADSCDLTVCERSIGLYDIYTSDECFLTGSGAELIPVVAADERIIADGKPGPVSLAIGRAFQAYINTLQA